MFKAIGGVAEKEYPRLLWITNWGWLGTNGRQEKLEGEVWQEVVRGEKWAI